MLRPHRRLVHHHPLERHRFPRTLHLRRDRMSPRWSRLFPDGRAQAVLLSHLFWAYSPDWAPSTTGSTIKDSSTSQFLRLLLSRCPATLARDSNPCSVYFSRASSFTALWKRCAPRKPKILARSHPIRWSPGVPTGPLDPSF